LLIATAGRALGSLPVGSSFVEVGSFCGRSTVVLASVVKAVGASSRVYAIDPHDGKVGAADQGLQSFLPTRVIFERNIAEHALSSVVETIPKPSFDVVGKNRLRCSSLTACMTMRMFPATFIILRSGLFPEVTPRSTTMPVTIQA